MDKPSQEGEKRLTLAYFFIAGTSVAFAFPLTMAAAEDILSGLVVPTSVVLVSISAPGFLLALTSPLFFDKIGNCVKIAVVLILMIAGFLLVGLAQSEWKLVGVILISISDTLGEMMFLVLTGLYQDSTVGAYYAGTGMALLAANLYYLALTVLLDVSHRATSWFPLIMIVSYLVLRKKETNGLGADRTTYEDYEPVPLTEQDHQTNTLTRLSIKEKYVAIWKTLHHLIALLIGIFATFLSLQGIASTLVYQQYSLAPRKVFVVYNSALYLASSVGRSYSFVCSLVKPNLNTFTKHTWALASAIVVIMLLLLIESWYRFLGSIVLVSFLLSTVGLFFGILYVNVFAMVGISEDARESAVTRVFVLSGWFAGMLLAALLALYVEPIIQQHCTYLESGRAELCLARSSTRV